MDEITTQAPAAALSLDNVSAAVSAAFNPCRDAVAAAVATAADVAFAYDDAAGNKAARSHVAKLRGIKGDIERTRKATKDAGLQFCRTVDSTAKEIVAEVEALITPHQAAIDEVANRQKLRLEQMQSIIESVSVGNIAEIRAAGIDSVSCRIAQIDGIEIRPELVYERTAEARAVKAGSLDALGKLLADLQREAAERAELERLRAEAAERKRLEDIRIAAEAAALNERIAAAERAAAEAARVEREKQEAEARAAAELERIKAESARKEAQAKAAAKREADAKTEAERQSKEIADLKQQQAAAEARRVADAKAREEAEAKAKAAKLAALNDRKSRAVVEVREFLQAEKGRGVADLIDAIAEGKIKTLILA